MLPNFICPGAARSATTALYYLLIQHPDVFLPSLKETRFFSRDYEKGLPWYEEKYYASAKNETIIGDISPVYLIDERCPERIHQELGPDIKLLFMLRNPIERTYSHYCMLQNHGFEDLSFEQAIVLEEEERIAKSLKFYEHEYGYQYLKESTYTPAIQRYLKYFNKDQIKYVLFEEFVTDTKEQLFEIIRFLGIDDNHEFNLDVYQNPKSAGSSRINKLFYSNPLVKKTRDNIQMKTGWKTQSVLKKLKTSLLKGRGAQVSRISEEMQKELYGHFEEDIRSLEALIDKDLSGWSKLES